MKALLIKPSALVLALDHYRKVRRVLGMYNRYKLNDQLLAEFNRVTVGWYPLRGRGEILTACKKAKANLRAETIKTELAIYGSSRQAWKLKQSGFVK